MPEDRLIILFLAANPTDAVHTGSTGSAPVAADEEVRAVDAALQQAALRDRFDLRPHFAVRADDMPALLLRYQPHIVHFCGSGAASSGAASSGAGGILVRDDQGGTRAVAPAALARLFAVLPDRLRCVVLNGVYDNAQARGILRSVDCVLGCTRAIDPAAAREFAVGFYLGLGYGRSLQTAFDLGRSRIALAGRKGVQYTRLVCARSDPAQTALTSALTAAPTASEGGQPWLMPYPRSGLFLDRGAELAALHAALNARRTPPHAPPVALTGLAGIGKTELAIEYCYRRRNAHAGVFWINAAGDLAAGFAAIGECLHPALAGAAEERCIAAAAAYLQSHPDALLVFDNLEEPAQLRRPLAGGLLPAALPCRILITTRRRAGRTVWVVEVPALPVQPGLALLLNGPTRRPVVTPAHPEHTTAVAIYHLLGGLPLALEVAGGFLAEWPTITLADFHQRLRDRGALATLDAESANLPAGALSGIHAAAVTAALGEQWDALQPRVEGGERQVDSDARLLLRIAGQLPEAVEIPAPRLALLAGLVDESEPAQPSRAARALHRLEQAVLVQELRGDAVNLHPLVREFAAAQTPADEAPALRLACAANLLAAYVDVAVLERHCARRGIEAVEQDVLTALALAAEGTADREDGPATIAMLRRLLRMLQRESHTLSGWDAARCPADFLEQWRKRALLEGELSFAAAAATLLNRRNAPWLAVEWLAACTAPALERTLGRHGGSATAVAVCIDGRRILSAGVDGVIRLWQAEGGVQLGTFTNPTGSPYLALAIVPDGRRLLAGAADGAIHLWDIDAGVLLRTLAGHTRRVRSLAVMPDGRSALSASEDRTVKLWDLRRGAERRTFSGHAGRVFGVAVTADGKRIVSAAADRTLRVWNLRSGRVERVLRGHTDEVRAVIPLPDAGRVLSAGWDGRLVVWDINTGAELQRLAGHDGGIYTVAAWPDGRRAVSGGADRTVRLWDLAAGAQQHILTGHTNVVRSVALLRDGQRVVSAAADGTVKLWDLAGCDALATVGGHDGPVRAVAVTRDGRTGLSAGLDGALKVWDMGTGRDRHTLRQDGAGLRALVTLPDNRTAVTGATDGALTLWDFERGAALRTWRGHGKGLRALAVSPDGRRLVSASDDHTLRVWDLPTGGLLHTLAGHDSSVYAAAVTPDGTQAVSASTDRTLIQWDLARGARLRTLTGHVRGVYGLAMLPDGRHVVSAAWDGTLRLWDLQRGAMVRTYSGHSSGVQSVAASPDGNWLLSASWDGTVKLWETASGREVASLGLDAVANAVAAANAAEPDASTFLVGDAGGGVLCLRWRSGDPEQHVARA